MKKVLVVHGLTLDARQTTVQHVSCFGKYLYGCEVYYANIFGFLGKVKEFAPFDVLVVTYDVLSYRNFFLWQSIENKLLSLRQLAKTYVMMPQDDYTGSGYLDNHALLLNADYIYSPILNDIDVLYPKSIKSGTKFREMLTGYLDFAEKSEVEIPIKPLSERAIDVGQRVRFLSPIYGELGQRKAVIGKTFSSLAKAQGFKIDFSTKPDDVLIGEDWHNFLLNIKFTISRKGGASLADPFGKYEILAGLLSKIPNIKSTNKIEKILKFLRAPKGNFSAVSPRLFEASSFGVCQILEEDDYINLFKPWEHYIPLKSDFSNVNEIFNTMRDLEACQQIANNAHQLIFNSDSITYKSFVKAFSTDVLKIPLLEYQIRFIDIDMSSISENKMSGKDFDLHRILLKQHFIDKFNKNLSQLGLQKIINKPKNEEVKKLIKCVSAELLQLWEIEVEIKNSLPESLLVNWVPASLLK